MARPRGEVANKVVGPQDSRERERGRLVRGVEALRKKSLVATCTWGRLVKRGAPAPCFVAVLRVWKWRIVIPNVLGGFIPCQLCCGCRCPLIQITHAGLLGCR